MVYCGFVSLRRVKAFVERLSFQPQTGRDTGRTSALPEHIESSAVLQQPLLFLRNKLGRV